MRRAPGTARRFKLALVVIGLAAAMGVAGASAGDFEHDTGPCTETPGNGALLRCTTAYVGMPYQVQIESEEGSGCWPYIWYEIVNGALPDGLTMTKGGLISGVPTGGADSLARFWVWNHDLIEAEGGPSWCQYDDRSEREFSIPVDPGLAINDTSVGPGTIGQPYSQSLTAKEVLSVNPLTGPDVPASWSVQSGSLPPGITLSEQGLLSGTPTAEGRYQFVVKAQNGSPFDTKQYTLSVRQPVTVKLPFAGSQPTAEVGVRLTKTLTVSGGSGTYTWTLASGALPSGVALDPSTGVLSGTPRSAGRFALSLTATDSEKRAASVSGVLIVAPKLTVETVRLKGARVGHAYRTTLAAGGGVRPLRWRLVRGKLPLGVRFAKSQGAVAGTPRRAGTFRVSVQARDALGASVQKTVVLVVER
ncbi:MAG TPA: Ig domain-containing protein [Gaiellaceae bacterium]|nr:Ig domain-containing protein [Gaiellaceae bacterium]